MKGKINKIFDNLDKWRHLPCYQLERRADIFFSLYLHGIMEERLKKKLKDIIIPEFPIKKDTNRTWKIDYILISEDKIDDKKYVFFVELKTDMRSIDKDQLERMKKIQNETFYEVLKDLITVMTSKHASKKYFHLFCQLYELGLYESSNAVKDILCKEDFKSLQKVMPCPSEDAKKMEIQVVCIQPKPGNDIKGFKYICFDSIIKYLNGDEFKSDTLAKRFIESLKNWETTKAGDAPYKNSIKPEKS